MTLTPEQRLWIKAEIDAIKVRLGRKVTRRRILREVERQMDQVQEALDAVQARMGLPEERVHEVARNPEWRRLMDRLIILGAILREGGGGWTSSGYAGAELPRSVAPISLALGPCWGTHTAHRHQREAAKAAAGGARPATQH
jgi:hypothetical protein